MRDGFPFFLLRSPFPHSPPRHMYTSAEVFYLSSRITHHTPSGKLIRQKLPACHDQSLLNHHAPIFWNDLSIPIILFLAPTVTGYAEIFTTPRRLPRSGD